MKVLSNRWIKTGLVIIGVFLLFITASVIYVREMIIKPVLVSVGDDNSYGSSGAEQQQVLFEGKPVNVLVIGKDQRGDDRGRSDAIHVYHFDPRDLSINILSIPRDTYVNIPGYGMDKINHAYAYGGIELSKKTVSEFLGVPIDHSVEINFEGFKNIIDKVGGITVDVEKDISEDGVLYIKKGLQRLNGELALHYVRDRWDPMGDIERVKRQQKFIRAVFKEVKGFEPKYKLLPNIPEIYSNVETDITLEETIQLYALLPWMKTDDIKVEYVQGDFMNLNGISYWKPDRKYTEKQVREVFFNDSSDKEGNDQKSLPQASDTSNSAVEDSKTQETVKPKAQDVPAAEQ
ncbi:MAG: LCP family protein [Firmicutes bacterium]|nr:LCP family protein [Bacillota bacterium]